MKTTATVDLFAKEMRVERDGEVSTQKFQIVNSRMVGLDEAVDALKAQAQAQGADLWVMQNFSVVFHKDYSGMSALRAPAQKSPTTEADPRSWIVRR